LRLPSAIFISAAALAHLHLVVLLGVLQQLERPLFRRQRFLGLLRLEVAFGGLHLRRRFRQRFRDRLEPWIDDADARFEFLNQFVDLGSQLGLRQVEEHDVLAELLGGQLRFVAHDVERRGDDLALLLRKLAHFAATASAASSLRLRGLVVLLERLHVHEVDVARRRLVAFGAVVVGGLRVVGDEVAGLHAQLLEVDRVAGLHFLQALAGAKELHGLLGAAVHRVEQLHVGDAEVVVGLGFDEDFLDGARRVVATRFDEGHHRRLILQDVDRVLRRRVHLLAVRSCELDFVEALVFDDELARERPIGLRRQPVVARFVHHDLPARRRHRRRDAHPHFGAAQRGDVAADVDFLYGQTRVGGEVILQFQLADGRQVEDRNGVGRRGDAVRLDVVRGALVEVEQYALESPRFGTRDERNALVLRALRGTRHERGILRREADQARGDRLIRSARDLRVSGRDLNRIRTRFRGGAREDQHRRQPVAQIGRSEDHEQERRDGNAGDRRRVALQRLLIDVVSALGGSALFDGLFDELTDQVG